MPIELTINQHFQTLTTFPPRNFQREAITKLLHRQDILLRAPTNSGKTFRFYSTQ
jgi:superfamily II RNA helicase